MVWLVSSFSVASSPYLIRLDRLFATFLRITSNKLTCNLPFDLQNLLYRSRYRKVGKPFQTPLFERRSALSLERGKQTIFKTYMKGIVFSVYRIKPKVVRFWLMEHRLWVVYKLLLFWIFVYLQRTGMS